MKIINSSDYLLVNRLLNFADIPSVSAPFFEAPGGLEA